MTDLNARRKTQDARRNKGLTLIELLVTLVISSLIIGAAVAVHLANQRLFVKESALIEVRNNVRGALDIIISDIREAGYNPTEAFPPQFDPAIRGADKSWISMVMDINENGICDSSDWQEYFHWGDSLIKHFTMLATNELVAENIDYLEFRYFDANDSELVRPVALTDLENIRAVRVIIVGKTSREFSNHQESGVYPDGTPYNDRCYRCWNSTFVRLRNI